MLDKLLFIGGEGGNFNVSKEVDLMDLLTVQVSPLPYLRRAREAPACVATENEILSSTIGRLSLSIFI